MKATVAKACVTLRALFASALILTVLLASGTCLFFIPAAQAEMEPYPVVKLRALDKISARTMTFEATVGNTLKYGPLYIKVQACRKAPPIEQPESAAFLQIWEVTPKGKSEWVFSGWMFASSPALSAMDHPVYDVWVLDCLMHKTGDHPASDDTGESAKQTHEENAQQTIDSEDVTQETVKPVDATQETQED